MKERYNQHLSTGMFILEVGSNGNSLQEAITAVRLFADAAGPALLELAGGQGLSRGQGVYNTPKR